MSRAFVKEPDGDQVADAGPERPISPHPNYVTPAGLARLEAALAAAEAERHDLLAAGGDALALQRVERDRRYYAERVKTAIPVRPGDQPADRVAFGATVEIADAAGADEPMQVRIVGEDEADAAAGAISWVSPLARALIGAQVGDVVTWRRPVGDRAMEVLAITPLAEAP